MLIKQTSKSITIRPMRGTLSLYELMQPLTIITAIVVLLIYAGVEIGRVPKLRMNRATIALTGAAILIAIGSINEKQAYAALDIGTILLLAAMMVINANLRMAYSGWRRDRVYCWHW